MEDYQGKIVQFSENKRCIVCMKKVRWKLGDQRNEGGASSGGEQTEEEEGETPPEMASKLLTRSPGFLLTFNNIWNLLNDNQYGSCDSEKISLETVINKGSESNATFSRVPTFCQYCCEKVVAVENLMKAVRQQVREIKMLLEESRRKPGVIFDDVEAYVGDFDVAKESGMELDEDHRNKKLLNSLNSQGQDDYEDYNVTAGDDAMEDDSNWEWDDNDDPDYIKSEQNDDDDTELISEDELDEKPLTLEENQNVSSLSKDPLEIPSSKTKQNFNESPGAKSPPKRINCDHGRISNLADLADAKGPALAGPRG